MWDNVAPLRRDLMHGYAEPPPELARLALARLYGIRAVRAECVDDLTPEEREKGYAILQVQDEIGGRGRQDAPHPEDEP